MRTPVIVSNYNNHPKPPDQGGGNDAVVQGVVEEAEAAGINDELPDIPLYRPTDNMRGDQEENNIQTEASTVPSQMVGLLCLNCGYCSRVWMLSRNTYMFLKARRPTTPRRHQCNSPAPAQLGWETLVQAQECHICDKSFKSHPRPVSCPLNPAAQWSTWRRTAPKCLQTLWTSLCQRRLFWRIISALVTTWIWMKTLKTAPSLLTYLHQSVRGRDLLHPEHQTFYRKVLYLIVIIKIFLR